ncbi:hypothetical protein L861_03910 [Litchfieldella anticariensis FP35 = DSM 16096]|uniref:Uncharacterized protein n=1 Tax=Litchfieldella anticariensis (strain DSM 16096 / CECT 5854 / CIP 108499 / LMG 22089 / FP35) TaxID=1121939 RepID=S2KV67_LITA3|nr:hypothetical protein [Halomonas anticariensis]EPC04478.1 hypothetical protein L861_03910 [Halomonas anticariensis FP35 = DSM 16096]
MDDILEVIQEMRHCLTLQYTTIWRPAWPPIAKVSAAVAIVNTDCQRSFNPIQAELFKQILGQLLEA